MLPAALRIGRANRPAKRGLYGKVLHGARPDRQVAQK